MANTTKTDKANLAAHNQTLAKNHHSKNSATPHTEVHNVKHCVIINTMYMYNIEIARKWCAHEQIDQLITKLLSCLVFRGGQC